MKRFKTDQHAELVSFVNEQIAQAARIPHIPLGSSYSQMSDDEIQNSLAVHRIADKFERPNDGNSKIRKDATIKEALNYDADGIIEFCPAKMVMDPQIRKKLYETRNLLSTVTSSYAYSVGLIEVTTGETFWSSGGDTSVLAKLRDKSQWCVTPECFDLFASTAYRVPALKKQVRWHYYNLFKQHEKLYLSMVRFYTDKEGESEERHVKHARRYFWKRIHKQNLGLVYTEHKDSRDIGFICFKEMLRKVVTFVGGTRFTTVPKNNVKDRVIECEAFCNMIVQRIIAAGIKKLIGDHFKIDLASAQYKHKAIISRWFDMIATIDLKNASNSNWMAVVRWLYAKSRLLRHVEFSRCSHVKIGDDWAYLNMVAPMGNGFTFELMTLTLLACCRVFDDTSRVFGDDIIVSKGVAPDLIALLKVLGYATNDTKTFIDGNFRESCGGFVSRTRKYLSYEFRWADDLFDAIVLVNKLKNLLTVVTGQTLVELTKIYQRIIDVVPLLCCCGYDKDIVPLEGAIYVHHKRLRKLQCKDKVCIDQLAKLRSRHERTLNDLQITRDLSPGVQVTKKSISYRSAPLNVRDPHWISYYLYGGRVVRPTLRKTQVTVETGLYIGHSANFLS